MKRLSGFVFGLVLWAAAVLVMVPATAGAAELRVVSGGSIQTAINEAVDGDKIVVEPGTYVENINFNGKAVTVCSTADWSKPEEAQKVVKATIIDGNQAGSVVKFRSGEGEKSVLSGFTIRNGKGNYDSGGGIYCDNSSPTITNCTISGNTGCFGGGIYCKYSSSPTITDCTISDNSVAHGKGGGCGGGVYCGYYSSPTITNSILWNNTPQEIALSSDGTITISYSDIKGGYAGEGNIDQAPLFVDPAKGDYHLKALSPCIDSGTQNGAPDQDQDGNKRPHNGYDMGAYESPYENPLIDTTPPYVLETSPANGKNEVDCGQSIIVTFSESVQETESGALGGVVLKGKTIVACTCSLEGDKLVIDPTTNLSYDTTYTVTIPAIAVKDLAFWK